MWQFFLDLLNLPGMTRIAQDLPDYAKPWLTGLQQVIEQFSCIIPNGGLIDHVVQNVEEPLSLLPPLIIEFLVVEITHLDRPLAAMHPSETINVDR